MLAPRLFELLVAQHRQGTTDASTRSVRHNDVVDVTAGASHERISKLFAIFRFTGCELFRVAFIVAEDDFDGAFCAHHRDLGIWPGKVHIATEMLGRHDVVGATIGLARDDSDFRHGALGIGIEQLCAVFDDAAVFLRCARHETWHIDEGHNRNAEGIAEAHETRSLDAALDIETTS